MTSGPPLQQQPAHSRVVSSPLQKPVPRAKPPTRSNNHRPSRVQAPPGSAIEACVLQPPHTNTASSTTLGVCRHMQSQRKKAVDQLCSASAAARGAQHTTAHHTTAPFKGRSKERLTDSNKCSHKCRGHEKVQSRAMQGVRQDRANPGQCQPWSNRLSHAQKAAGWLLAAIHHAHTAQGIPATHPHAAELGTVRQCTAERPVIALLAASAGSGAAAGPTGAAAPPWPPCITGGRGGKPRGAKVLSRK